MKIYDWMHCTTQTEREAVAKAAQTTVAYLWQLSGSHRSPSRKLAERLEEATMQITPDRVIDKISALFGENQAA